MIPTGRGLSHRTFSQATTTVVLLLLAKKFLVQRPGIYPIQKTFDRSMDTWCKIIDLWLLHCLELLVAHANKRDCLNLKVT
jgi:hypothetical protein